jgi:LysR family hydrogen peroxide-inducible transcriptional activator
MEFNQLRYVCAVAETGSFSRAAERCQVAQPSLSQQVLKLEKDLGAKLFDRLGRSVRLTEAGRAFLSHARSILSQMETARSSVADTCADLRGSVAVGAIPTIAPYLMPRYTTAFAKKYPDANLRIVEETTPILVQGLHAQSKSLALRDLRGESFVMLRDGHCFRDLSLAACTHARVTPRIAFESGQFSSLFGMVAAGVGISIVPEMAIDRHAGCRYVRLRDPRATRNIVAAILRGRSLNRVQHAFLSGMTNPA